MKMTGPVIALLSAPPALVTVVTEVAGVSVSLGQPGELLVPLQLHHVAPTGLAGPT